MRIPVHHSYDSQAHTHFRCGDHHDEKNKNLSVDACIGIREYGCCMMHFRKSDQQEVHRIQHQFDAHENDDGIPARKYTGHADAEKRNTQKYVIVDGHGG